MVPRRFQDAKTGMSMMNSLNAEKFLKKIGLGKEDHHFWKQVGKALLCTYTLFGIAWLWNETSPLGWWTLKPKPKEEKELAHLYERRKFPYPGDEEAMKDFVAKGGMIETTIGPKGVIEMDKDSYNYQKAFQDKKFDQEALKIWLRMRNEDLTDYDLSSHISLQVTINTLAGLVEFIGRLQNLGNFPVLTVYFFSYWNLLLARTAFFL